MILPLLAGCGKYQRIQIADVTKPVTLTLTPPLGHSTLVDAFSLHIWGEIDGSADIWGTDLETNHYTNGKWKFEILRSGPFNATNCVIEYRPEGVRTGKISIEYDFHCVE
jgi:hypothetical protein